MRKPSRCHGVRLSGADRKRLAAALETAGEARVYRRVEALLLVAEGQSVAEGPRRCRVDRSSVHRWLAKCGVGRDAAALVDRPRSGRPRQSSRLTPRRLAAVLARDPRRCGYLATSWTVPLLVHYLATWLRRRALPSALGHCGADFTRRTIAGSGRACSATTIVGSPALCVVVS